MAKTYYFQSPGGEIPAVIGDIIKRNHVLIAGTSGSGKSTLINSIIYNLTHYGPAEKTLLLIDPKRVDLVKWAGLPHVIEHVTSIEDALQQMRYIRDEVIETRYKIMAEKRQSQSDLAHIYIIIDELADLMTTRRTDFVKMIQSIGQIGRAANVHMICATQCPLAKIIPTEIKVNFDGIVGLRTRSAQDSRNILGVSGCEDLPQYGYCLYDSPVLPTIEMYDVPYYTDDVLNKRIAYWEKQMPHKWFGKRYRPGLTTKA